MSRPSTQVQVLGRALRRSTRKVRSLAQVKDVRRLGERLSVPDARAVGYCGPEDLASLRDAYVVRPDMPLVDGRIPLIWWTDTANFGDLLSPWLVGRIAGRPVSFASRRSPASMVAIGSVVTRARAGSLVWGSGSFGSERRSLFNSGARYQAVRGPLTRSKLLDVGIECPRIYGDPALLVPLYFWPAVEKTHDVGVVVRHSEQRWKTVEETTSARIIDFGSMEIEETLRAILSCRRIVSSSLHGLIIADAYGIPNAWLGSERSTGGSRPNGGSSSSWTISRRLTSCVVRNTSTCAVSQSTPTP